MTDSNLDKEWAELIEWEYQESENIDKKYPYRGGFDNCKEAHDERQALKKQFIEKVNELKRKYNIQ